MGPFTCEPLDIYTYLSTDAAFLPSTVWLIYIYIIIYKYIFMYILFKYIYMYMYITNLVLPSIGGACPSVNI